MAHEIHEHDHVVLHREKAWHGLGTVVEDAPTPTEALRLARLDWEVEPCPLYANFGEDLEHRLNVESFVANVRKDTREVLGVVGSGYEIIQNRELAEFCELLAGENTVKVESAGSIQNGRKVWFLLKGESFEAAPGDFVKPYLCVSNGHTGNASNRYTPTSVRVVCSNTLHMVIPRSEKGRISRVRNSYAVRHSGNLSDKLEEVRQALGLYDAKLADFRATVDELARQDVNHETVKQFFLDAYSRHHGSIPAEPTNKSEERKRRKAMDFFNRYDKAFQLESEKFGASKWIMANAYTNVVQHTRARGRDDAARDEAQLASNLFGTNSERSSEAFAIALSA